MVHYHTRLALHAPLGEILDHEKRRTEGGRRLLHAVRSKQNHGCADKVSQNSIDFTASYEHALTSR